MKAILSDIHCNTAASREVIKDMAISTIFPATG
jgi:hypothetical protein